MKVMALEIDGKICPDCKVKQFVLTKAFMFTPCRDHQYLKDSRCKVADAKFVDAPPEQENPFDTIR